MLGGMGQVCVGLGVLGGEEIGVCRVGGIGSGGGGGGGGGRGKVGVCQVGKEREEGREENMKIWRRHEEGRGGRCVLGK